MPYEKQCWGTIPRCREISTSTSVAPNGPTWDEQITNMNQQQVSWTPGQVWYQVDKNGMNVLRQGYTTSLIRKKPIDANFEPKVRSNVKAEIKYTTS